MDRIDVEGYEIVREQRLGDIGSDGYVFRHRKSGARVCVISNDDDNKVFYIGFRTPPQDETGTPHIIEHTTLCGSEQFPAKDPFIELVKGSLNTFLNAMTYPEKTLYPVASCNLQDFKNLMHVYMDAVFHPNITKVREIFMQEGWHYELESKDAPLTVNGVVYSEMKGAYSSPEEILQTAIMQTLFPDNAYGKDSGGNPAHIPELTYEDYISFYKKYYHPSNSYIYLYGDMDIAERLTWMDREYLGKYDWAEVDAQIPIEPVFEKVAHETRNYPVTDDEPEEKRAYLSYNKVVATVLDRTLYQAFDVLDYVLGSAPGAPVKKALIDAGIGEEVYSTYMDGMLQPVFSFVAKNADAKDEEKFVKIIEDTLREQVKIGLDPDALLAGINSAEFRFREADYGQFPKGLIYGLSCMESWQFDDRQPFLHIECLDTLDFLRQKIGTGYFEELIEQYLLDNPHGAVVTVCPKKGLGAENEKALEKKLSDYKNSLSEEELDALVEQTARLRKYQEEPSSDEDLKKIPMLSRDDMKREAQPFTNIEEKIGDTLTVRHEVETNGIDYISLLFDVTDIPQEDVACLGLLRSILGYVDTAQHDYAGLANAVNIHTGGINCVINAHPSIKTEGKMGVYFEVRVKALHSELTEALRLLGEILRTSSLADKKRLGEIIAETRARLSVTLSSSGNSVAASRALSYESPYAFYNDETGGVGFYALVKALDMQMKNDPAAVADRLGALMEKILVTDRLTVSYIGNEKMYKESAPLISDMLKELPKGERAGAPAAISLAKRNEGLFDASQIQYVARGGNFKSHGFAYTGALKILKVVLNFDYLWINLRVVGGAYGCSSIFHRTGESYFTSYRDPNLAKTNEAYEGIPDYLAKFDPDERDMTKYIIGTFSSLDAPLTPETRGNRSMTAYLEDITEGDIQRERDEVLAAGPEDIRALEGLVRAILSDSCLCVIGNEGAIRGEKELFGEIRGLCE